MNSPATPKPPKRIPGNSGDHKLISQFVVRNEITRDITPIRGYSGVRFDDGTFSVVPYAGGYVFVRSDGTVYLPSPADAAPPTEPPLTANPLELRVAALEHWARGKGYTGA